MLAVNRDALDEITLQEEMAFIEDYLAIERLRLGDRLQIVRDLAPDALACLLPAFSVQPLVENAIGHAISPRREGGTITLLARVRKGSLEIEVADDGAGAEMASLQSAKGVGLAVVRKRLVSRYGEKSSMTVQTSPGSGFRVSLALPAYGVANEASIR